MDFTILIENMNNVNLDTELVDKVEKTYTVILPEEVKKIISLSKEPLYSDGWRTLSAKEVLHATEFLGYDFVSMKKIPLIDAFDNNFVVYSANESCWEYVNIVDEIEYAQAQTLADLI